MASLTSINRKIGVHKRALVKLRKIRKRLRKRRPKIITGASIGIQPSPIFGGLGTPHLITGHYTAGPRDLTDDHAIQLFQSYDRQHRAQGWGGIGYHYGITKAGTIVGLRPAGQKGAHTAGYNSSNIGIVVHGTTGDRATAAQERALRWLLDNAHTSRMPAAHRTSAPISRIAIKGHKEQPGQATSCPGDFLPFYHRAGK